MVPKLMGGEYAWWKIGLDPDTLLHAVGPGPAHVEVVLQDQGPVRKAGAQGTVEEAGVTVKIAEIAEVKRKTEVSRGITAAAKREVQTRSTVREGEA